MKVILSFIGSYGYVSTYIISIHSFVGFCNKYLLSIYCVSAAVLVPAPLPFSCSLLGHPPLVPGLQLRCLCWWLNLFSGTESVLSCTVTIFQVDTYILLVCSLLGPHVKIEVFVPLKTYSPYELPTHTFIYWFIHWFTYSTNIYSVLNHKLGAARGVGDSSMNKTSFLLL